MQSNKKITVQANLWNKLFHKIKSITWKNNQLIINKKTNKIVYDLSCINYFPTFKKSFWGNKIILNNINLPTLSKRNSKHLFNEILHLAIENIKRTIQINITQFKQLAIQQYLKDSNITKLNQNLQQSIILFNQNKLLFKKHFPHSITTQLQTIASFYPINTIHTQKLRNQYEKAKLIEQKSFFDTIEDYPLTEQQRLAAIRYNDINMILAAAGTGKTSVIVAKVLDLIKSGKAQANEILILAYNRDATLILTERLNKRAQALNIPLINQPHIKTFHAIGRSILKNCQQPVHLSELAQNSSKLEIWLNNWITNYIQQSPEKLNQFLKMAHQPINHFQFKNKQEYDQSIHDNSYRTLQGEYVNQYPELLIANWLFLNGINYEYQPRYISKRRIDQRWDYRPNFGLGNGIYLEYFCLNQQGLTPQYIDDIQYHENIQKKRNLHTECQTTLLEIYHHHWAENTLYTHLQSLMQQHAITIKPKTEQEIYAALKTSKIITENKNRYLKCLKAIRTERLNKDQILQRLTMAKIEYAEEYTHFLMNMHDAYIQKLHNAQQIDFDDMILQATQCIQSGQFKSKWKYIFVDEFQDISMARLTLLQEIYAHSPNATLTVVGDDWQSIYRFAGAKLEATTHFQEIFGSHTLSKLEKTYRYNNSIAHIAGQFIMRNPEQYKKNITTHTQVDHSCVYLHDCSIFNHHSKQYERNIAMKAKEVITHIHQEHPNASIAILARYHYLLNEVKELIHNTKIQFWTFHGSKGLEADYCILLGFFQGKTGFPNKNKEESLIEALLPALDKFPYSEERRLFYVALTRAKHESHIIADAHSPSEFVDELLTPTYQLNIVSKKFKTQYRNIFKCPACSIGYLILKQGKFGHFYTCSSGSMCAISPRICSKCRSPSIDFTDKSICQNPNCRHQLPICHQCGRPMKLRNGKFGHFWGCSGYGLPHDSCRQTRKNEFI